MRLRDRTIPLALRCALVLVVALGDLACVGDAAGDSDGGSPGTGGGGGGADSGGAVFDSGAVLQPDAGPPDGGVGDAGVHDAGEVDAGPTDAGTTDAGAPDAGPVDSGAPALDAGEDGGAAFDAGPDDSGIDAGPADSGIDAGSSQLDAGALDAGLTCPVGRGPRMITLDAGFCIDETEVTLGHYGAFLSAGVSTSGQAAVCAWNTSWDSIGLLNLSSVRPLFPVTSIDWCDAQAFCGWAGKRLCGRPGGGATPFDQFSDAASSQWFRACAGATGTRAYSYGPFSNASVCNGSEMGVADVRPVGSFSNCRSVGENVFDLNGNAWEWEDSCTSDGGSGATDLCRARGGSFADPAGISRCDLDSNLGSVPLQRNEAYAPNVGFRCCFP